MTQVNMEIEPFGHVPEKKEDVVFSDDISMAYKLLNELPREEYEYRLRGLNNFRIRPITDFSGSNWVKVRNVVYNLTKKVPILLPEQILILNSELGNEFDTDTIESFITGPFITSLIQKSYNNGNNNFHLTFDDYSLDYLLTGLSGRKKDPINIEIIGDVGKGCAQKIKYCKVNILGNALDYIGTEAYKSFIAVNNSKRLGYGAKKSSFHSKGHAYVVGKLSRRCDFLIDDYFSIGMDDDILGRERGDFIPRNSIFKTYSKEVYNAFEKKIPPGNKIELLDSKGVVNGRVIEW